MGSLEKMCPTGEFRFMSLELAERIAKEMRLEFASAVHCEACGKFHLTPIFKMLEAERG